MLSITSLGHFKNLTYLLYMNYYISCLPLLHDIQCSLPMYTDDIYITYYKKYIQESIDGLNEFIHNSKVNHIISYSRLIHSLSEVNDFLRNNIINDIHLPDDLDLIIDIIDIIIKDLSIYIFNNIKCDDSRIRTYAGYTHLLSRQTP